MADFSRFGTPLDFSSKGQGVDQPDFSQGGTALDFSGAGSAIDNKPKTSRTWGEVASDLAVSFGSGAGGLLEMGGTLYGLATGDMDNAARRQGERTREFYQERKSPGLLAREERKAQAIDDADGELAKFWATIKETVTDPALFTSFLAEQIPNMVAPGAVGQVAGRTAVKLGAGRAVAAGAATGAAVGAGSALQGADSGADAYDRLLEFPTNSEQRKALAEFLEKEPEDSQVQTLWAANNAYQKLIDQGASEEDARKQVSLELARWAFIKSAAVSAGVNLVIPGARSIERVLGGGTRAAGPGGVRGALSGAAKGFAGEALAESSDEAFGRYASNVAVQGVDPSQSAIEGVGQAFAEGALFGPVGAVTGAIEGSARPVPGTIPPGRQDDEMPPGAVPASELFGEEGPGPVRPGEVRTVRPGESTPINMPDPPGMREQAQAETPPLTQEDIASPIPDDIIQQGKAILQDALNPTESADALPVSDVRPGGAQGAAGVGPDFAAGGTAVEGVPAAGLVDTGAPDFAGPVDLPGAGQPGADGPALTPAGETPTASWVIRNKETGEVVIETFDRAKVDALNTEKYEAVPVQQHLGELNTRLRAEREQPSPTVTPASEAVTRQKASAGRTVFNERTLEQSAAESWGAMNTYERNAAATSVLGARGALAKSIASRSWDALTEEQRSSLVAAVNAEQGQRWTDPNRKAVDQDQPVLQNRDRSSAASIQQMHAIAKKPDYDKASYSRTFMDGAPVVLDEMPTMNPEATGRREMVTTAGDRRIPIQYAVIEAGQLLPSNKVDGSINPEYATGAEGKSRAIAGNGRVAGLTEAWRRGTADEYKARMMEDADAHGIAPAIIEAMKQPVLVRLMPTSEVTANIGDVSNTPGQLGMDSLEQAKTDMNRISLGNLKYGEDGEITIDTVMDFIRGLPETENLVSGGTISREARDRLEAAVFHKAYGNDDLTRMQAERDEESRSIISALTKAAPQLARLEGAGVYDIRPLITEAATTAITARRRGIPLRKYVRQQDMGVNPAIYPILEMMLNDRGHIRSANYIGEQLINMGRMAHEEASSAGMDLFGERPRRTQEQVISDSLTEVQGNGQLNVATGEAGMGEPRRAESDAPVDEGTEGGQPGPADPTPAQPAESAGSESQRISKAADGPSGFSLETQTEESLAQAEAARQEAAAAEASEKARQEAADKREKDAAGDRARADQIVDDFQLGQTPEEAMSGMGDIFGHPPIEESQPSIVYSTYEPEASNISSRERGVSEPSETAQIDLFAPSGVPDNTARAQSRDNFNIQYRQAEVGSFKVGLDTVLTPEDAAHVMAPLRKHAQESFLVLVTDKKGKILNLIRHTKGLKAQSSVSPLEVAGAVASTEGSAVVWLGHNHPSGSTEPSNSDVGITEKLIQAFDGLGVEVKGHIILPGGQAATLFTNRYDASRIPIRPALRARKQPLTERVLRRKNLNQAPSILSDTDAKNFVSTLDEDSIVLLSNSHQVVGTIVMSPAEMKSLREGGRVRRILSALDSTNSAAAVIYTNDQEAAVNLARFFTNMDRDYRILDWISKSKGELVSDSSSGGRTIIAGGPFFSVRDGSAPTQEGSSPASIESLTADLSARLKQLGIADKVSLKLQERIQAVIDGKASEADGQYMNRLIEVSLSAPNKRFTLNHEVVHALRDLGLINDAEWRALVRAANADTDLMASIDRRYKDLALAADEKNEEAVADMFGRWSEDKQAKGFIRTAFRKIQSFLEALGNALRGNGFNSVDSIFRAIERGDVGRRQPRDARGRFVSGAAESFSNPSISEKQTDTFSQRQPLGFYRELDNRVAQGPPSAMKGQWKDYINGLKRKGVKPDEIEWSGVLDWLDLQEGRVSREQVRTFLSENGVQVEEVVLGDDIRVTGQPLSEMDSAELEWLERYEDELDSDQSDRLDELRAGVTRKVMPSPKYADYTVPGDSSNYREVLLTLPEKKNAPVDSSKSAATMLFERDMLDKYGGESFPSVYGRLNGSEIDRYEMLVREDRNAANSASLLQDRRNNYKSAHWTQPNVIAHVRISDRVDADGNKVLFVEEVQSDWAQDGRKRGFASDAPGYQVWDDVPGWGVIQEVRGEGVGREFYIGGLWVNEAKLPAPASDRRARLIPPAPFVTSTDKWTSLAIKRILTMATEGGYDKVAFVSGEQAAEMFDLSKQISEVNYNLDDERLTAHDHSGDRVIDEWVAPESLDDYVGKELADRIRSDAENNRIEQERERGEWSSELDEDPDTGEEFYIITDRNGDPLHSNFGDLERFDTEADAREWIDENVATELNEVSLSGLDLKVGGEGMKGFYDNILPKVLRNVTKRIGGELGSFSTGEQAVSEIDDFLTSLGRSPVDEQIARPNIAVTITPEMREKITTKGLPMFSLRQDASAQSSPSRGDYRGQHQAPGPDGGAPGHDLTGGGNIYPEDFYGPNGLRYYGDGSRGEAEAYHIIASMKGRPNRPVKIYRAVPHEQTRKERIKELERQLDKYMARRLLPPGVTDEQAWYEETSTELEALRASPEEAPAKKLTLNPGDWVTITRSYAVDHGVSALRGKYKIISKTVKAKEIFTNGDSLQEWGYWPEGTFQQGTGNRGQDGLVDWEQRETAPVGAWVKADYKLDSGQPVYQVRELRVDDLYLPELDEAGRIQPEKRRYLPDYTARAQAGEQPPTIDVIEMEDGRLRVVDGHRRVMAARAAGIGTIRALVSPLVNTPDGKKGATAENILNQSALPDTIEVDGQQRPTTNSNGQPIAPTEQSLRNFWRWFGDSKVVDDQGRPLVVYHSTLVDIEQFNKTGKFMGHTGVSGISVTDNPEMASRYLERFANMGWVDGKPNQPFSKNVMPLYVRAENPLYRDEPIKTDLGLGAPLPPDYVNPVESQGYDALIRNDAISRKGGVKHSDAKNAIRGREIVLFNPEQIKSAIGNDGTYGQQNPDIRYQLSDNDRNLYIAHNLSADNLIHADEIGGLAAPSLAVANIDTGAFEGFGEITLLADPSIIESRGARTFDADVYSPRHPQAVYQIKGAEYRSLADKADALPGDLEMPDISQLESGPRSLLNSDAMKQLFLAERQQAPLPKRSKVEPWVKKAAGLGVSPWNLSGDPRFQSIAEKEARRQVGELKKLDPELGAKMEAEYFRDGELSLNTLSHFANKAGIYIRSGGIDTGALRRSISRKMRSQKRRDDYEQWVTDQFNSMVAGRKIFRGFTNAGSRRYTDYTLENIVREMTRALRGGEGFNYGAGSVRSAYATELKTVAQVKKQRDKIVSAEDMGAIKEESQDRLVEALDQLKPYYKYDKNSFGYMDDASSAITEGPSGWREAFDLDADGRKIITDLIEYLRNLPTEYFETKMQRAVGINEFKYAVVPRGTSKKAIEILKSNGLTVRYYKKGDKADRTRAIKGARGALFQMAFHGTPYSFDRFSLEAIGTGEGAQAYGWGLYFAGKRAVGEYYRETLSGKLSENAAAQVIERNKPAGSKTVAHKLLTAFQTVKHFNSDDLVKIGIEPENLGFEDANDEVSVRNIISSNFGAEDYIKNIDGVDVYQMRDGSVITDSGGDLKALDGELGNLYQVDIPEDSELLDWDAPLTEQPEKVRVALENVSDNLQKIVDRKNSVRDGLRVKLPEKMGNKPRYTLNDLKGKDIYEGLLPDSTDQRDVSILLNGIGIPGLRYLDGSSRGTGDGSRNYVIWDESLITVEAINDELRQAQRMSMPSDGALNVQAVTDDLAAAMEKLGIAEKVTLRLKDNIQAIVDGQAAQADGRYFNAIIEVSLSAPDARFTLNHEAIHALKDLGLFKDAEWRALERAVKGDAGRMSDVRARYAGMGLSESQIVEEAIADLHGDWANGQHDAKGFIRAALERVRSFLEALGNALRGNGFNSADSIFRAIGRGDVGRRPGTDTADGVPAFSVDFGQPSSYTFNESDYRPSVVKWAKDRWGEQVAPNGKPIWQNFVRGFGDSKVVDAEGKPLRVYHGTNKDITKFKTDRPAWFSATPELANKFVGGGRRSMGGKAKRGSAVYPAYLSIQNPLDLTEHGLGDMVSVRQIFEKAGIDSSEAALRELAQRNLDSGFIGVADSIADKAGFIAESYGRGTRLSDLLDDRGLIETVKEAGFDGWALTEDGSNTYAVFDPTQIKSATGNSGNFDPSNPDIRYSLSDPEVVDPMAEGGAQARQQAANKWYESQPLDHATRLPFQLFGGINERGEYAPGAALADKTADIIRNAKFSEDGKFAWMNPTLESARAGIIDRYGLEEDYIERDRQRGLDERRIMAQVPEIMRALQESNIGTAESKVLQAVLTGEAVADADMAKLAEPIRNAIDDMGAEAVQLGLISAESFERNRGAYLHRVYLKHESDQSGLARWVSRISSKRRRSIVGNQFKGRGMWIEVGMGRLMANVPGFTGATTGRPVPGHKFRVLDLLDGEGHETLRGVDPKSQKKILNRVFLPEDADIPPNLMGYADRGTWEVRGDSGKNLVLWRDFTKAERTSMGEIVDARYTIAKTYMQMAHDLATGRFFKDIALNTDWSTDKEPPADKWKNSQDYNRFWMDPEVEWVKVPNITIPKSNTKRYGALSGRWVKAEIWRDLEELNQMQKAGLWNSVLTQWKLNKTARSPVVHMNNILSNLVLMDMADVRMADLVRAMRSMATNDKDYQEAVDSGAFGSDMVAQELRKNTLQPLLEQIERDMQGGKDSIESKIGILGKLADAVWSGAKNLDRKMTSLYQLEDEVFRMATYVRNRSRGMTASEAAIDARDQFLNYDIRAPWVNAARRTVLPFLSYTYRAVPVIARSIALRPWKVAKYATIGYAANALAYMLTGDDEDEERRSFDKTETGRTWIGAPRMIKMPYADPYGNPVFLDIRRWIPAGDVFDMNQGHGAFPVPAPLQFGGPLMLGAELALNKQAFTGDEITNDLTDDWWDKTSKVGGWAWKSWMPSAAWIPGSWYWERIGRAMTGARDPQGRPYSLASAIPSAFGVKLKPQDVQEAFYWKGIEFGRIESELKSELRRLGRDLDRGMISRSTFEKREARIFEKMENLGEERARTFNPQ